MNDRYANTNEEIPTQNRLQHILYDAGTARRSE